MSKQFKHGDLVSVWHRPSRRHKWRCEFSLVRVLQINGPYVTLQTSRTGQVQRNDKGAWGVVGATGVALRGIGTFQRELRKPIYKGW